MLMSSSKNILILLGVGSRLGGEERIARPCVGDMEVITRVIWDGDIIDSVSSSTANERLGKGGCEVDDDGKCSGFRDNRRELAAFPK
jgi:hypothetical protein